MLSKTRTRRRLVVLGVVSALSAAAAVLAVGGRLGGGRSGSAGDENFEVRPYLQLGDSPDTGLALLWQAADRDDAWAVDLRRGGDGPWVETPAPAWRRRALEGSPPARLYRAALAGLAPGSSFAYRVRRSGRPVFQARGSALKPAGVPHRFVAFGDCAAGTAGQRAVAYRASLARPDYVMITGDVVYMRGRASEYLRHFFPVYNSDAAGPGSGAPLLRSIPFVAAAGNHDLIDRDLDRLPDGLAYFYYLAQPLNGPPAPRQSPALVGAEGRRRAFLEAAGPAYPRMANFSFDYGDVHWAVLDANPYADWTDPALLGWLEADLAAAKRAAWRLAAFHQPGFHSSVAHADDQRMRVLAPVFERHDVSLVLSGHVHNYERSRPLRFAPADPASPYGPGGRVEGAWAIDGRYDGRTRTLPDGVTYLVTGAGGARLYDPDRDDDPHSWQPFTARFVARTHSLTVVDVTPEALAVRQVSADGEELDRFIITH